MTLWFLIAARNAALGRHVTASVQAAGGVAGLATWLVARKASTERHVRWIGHVALGVSTTALLTVALLNGATTTTPFILTLVPVAAAYVLGPGPAIAWAILTFAGSAAVNVVARLGLVQPEFHQGLWEIVLGNYLPVHTGLLVLAIASRRATDAQIAKAQLSETQVRAQSAELEAARDAALEGSRAKGAFLATMSHELRTPLNAIIGMASVVDDTNLSRDQRECIETIRTSGETLLSLIADILDFSKIEAGKMETERVPVELARCVDDAIDLVAAAAAKKGLEITRDIAPGVPPWVATDRARLQQVLLNLLSNAVKFTSAGDVTVTVRARELGEGRYEVELRVEDQGIGIPADKVDRLFTPFKQVDASTTREYGGTGLGLAISKALVTLLGGKIWVESVAGVGSTFGVTLEVQEAEGIEPSVTETLRADGRPLRVLLVSKHRRVRASVEALIRSLGATVSAVSSVSPAEASGGWDAAVVDAGRARPEDLSDAREVKRLMPALPVVLLVPLGRHEGLLESFAQTEIAQTIPKPVKETRLRRAIARAAAGDGSSARAAKKDRRGGAGSDRSRRVLVADDNPVNQKVQRHLLEHLGHEVDVVSDGLEAIEAMRRRTYDAVFLDVQMPRLDGLATARMAASEFTDAERPRLIALTANAGADDREACLAAGMNDYLSKPVRLRDIEGAMRSVPRLRGRDGGGVARAAAGPDDALLDMRTLTELKRLEDGGAQGLLASLVDSFLGDVPKRIVAIEEALAHKSAHDVELQAHTVKGSAATLGVVNVQALAERIEESAASGDLEALAGATGLLRAELARAERALRRAALGES